MTAFAEPPLDESAFATLPHQGAGGHDWLAIWQAMHDAEHAQTVALAGQQPVRDADRWAGKARRFAQSAGRAAQPDAFLRAILPQLRLTDTLLDIGAGTGRHTAFLAQHVAQVFAVEPSASMREQLQRLDDRAGQHVTVLPESWPSADVPACDIAICAHVVYGVREIGPFLARMHHVARRACFLLVGFCQPSFALSPFWEAIYGVPRLPLPGALECLNVLYQLGIPAQLSLLPTSRYRFADRQEALEDLRWRLYLPNDAASEALITAAIDALLERDGSGWLALPNQPEAVAMLWWTHTPKTQP